MKRFGLAVAALCAWTAVAHASGKGIWKPPAANVTCTGAAAHCVVPSVA